MVMHARKYQRLNDGYYERGQTHPYEDKNSTKHRHYDERYGEGQRESPNLRYGGSNADGRGHRERDESPASRSGDRYQNKSAYMERNKDKEKGNSIDKRSNHDRSYKGSKNREQKEKDHRAEVRKSAVRVCADWSEHLSSSGKYYYYNCKTEVSRWEKPKDWDDKLASNVSKAGPIRNSDGKDRRIQHHAQASKVDERYKHSSSATVTSSTSDHPRPSNSRGPAPFTSPNLARHHSFEHTDSKYRQSQSQATGSSANSCSNNNSSQNKSGQPGHRTNASHANSWPAADHGKRESLPMSGHSGNMDRSYSTPERPQTMQDHRGNSSGSRYNDPSLRSTSHTSDYNGSRPNRGEYQGSHQAEDMDISPGSTPTEESMKERHASMTTNTVSTPVSIVTGTPPSASRPSPSSSNVLSMLANLTSMSNVADLPALASLTSLAGTSPGGSSVSPATLLPQLLQQLTGGGRSTSNAHPHSHQNQQVLKQGIQVLQQMQQTLLMQQKQQQQRQLQQLLVTQLHQLQVQLQQQQTPTPGSKLGDSNQLTTPQPHTAQQQQHHNHPQHHHKKTEDGNQSPYSPPDESDGTPLQSPEHNSSINNTSNTQHQPHSDHCRESPHSEHSLKSSRRESPAPSNTSTQNVSSLGASQLSAAHRKNDNVHLSSSLAQYYDDKLINHVSGLIYDQTERQADLIGEEAHTIGSIMVSQVSVDLKGARSLVRAGEIISTSHEQRILFIRQQIKDLDNWRTQTTFMPSSSLSSSKSQKEET